MPVIGVTYGIRALRIGAGCGRNCIDAEYLFNQYSITKTCLNGGHRKPIPWSYAEPVVTTINESIHEPDNARDIGIHGCVDCHGIEESRVRFLSPRIKNKIILCRSDIGAVRRFTQFNIIELWGVKLIG